jgi:2-amino-4-hydroxy-6-hydroxymethyldihydropteridine diphosphokinase
MPVVVETEGVEIALPAWARVGEKRRAHIVRVTALLDTWARGLRLSASDARLLHDAGVLHDALRDAPEAQLRELTGDRTSATELLHGPAAAVMLEREGETRRALVEAVRWHTVGHPDWEFVGRALFMADYLEPGRKFSPADRAFLAAHAPHDFDGVFRQVVRSRLEWSLRDGKELFPTTVAMWNRCR